MVHTCTEDLTEHKCANIPPPLVLVTNKKSPEFYRQLNSRPITLKYTNPLRRIDDTLDILASKQWFTTLDLDFRGFNI